MEWIIYYFQCMCCQRKETNHEESFEGKRNSINVSVTDSCFIVETNNDSIYTNDSLYHDGFLETVVTNPITIDQMKTKIVTDI